MKKAVEWIDLNTADREPFIKASEDLLGKENVAWMQSWKPLQDSSGFRLYCKALGLEIGEYEDVAKSLAEVKDYKESEYYKDENWRKLIDASRGFVGVVEGISESPCSMMLGINNVRENVGMIRTKTKPCCLLDGYNCDKYKYLKNDYLKVEIWSLIDQVCKLANIPIPTISELNNLLDDKTFKIYEDGLTCTINQADSLWATGLVKKYKPKNVAEMSAFVAVIRPGCASFLDDFLSRKPYSTGIEELDLLLKEGNQRMLYQELIMKYLIWLGIPETGSYDIIKKIAKKKFKEEELKQLKTTLLQGWKNKLNTEDGFEETWETVEDAARYSFNCSHSLAYAYDSLYGAYLKSHYPLEYYTVALNMYSDDLDRTPRLIKEMEIYHIKLKNPKFRHSKSDYFMDKKQNTIYKGISSIKFLNENCAKELYTRKDNVYNNFIELLVDLVENSTINSKQIKILIQLDFFEEFGKSLKLLNIFTEFTEGQFKYQKTYCEKTKQKRLEQLLDMEFEDLDMPIKKQIETQIEYLGSPTTVKEILRGYAYVLDVNTKGSPKISLYGLGNGKTTIVKVFAKNYKKKPINIGDIIGHCTFKQKRKMKKEGDEWVATEELEWWLEEYEIERIGF